MEVNPLSVIFVKSDSKGDRLLFRYPFEKQENNEPANLKKRNPYALTVTEDLLQSPPPPLSNINKGGGLTGISDEVLSSLFAVKPELCNQKFELKVNDVRFVGHPTLLQLRNKSQDESGVLLINVVFALQALASHSIVKCYHELSQQIGIALRYEENRCNYVTEEIVKMVAIHDDYQYNQQEEAFKTILKKCTMAAGIKKLYEQLSNTGLVNMKINKWIPISFCLPQKVHQWHLGGKIIEPGDIDRCLEALRPYHGLLLLHNLKKISNFLGLDCSPTLIRLLHHYSPLKSLQTLAIDSDLTLNHVFELTSHLVYWGKATVIYPICSTNKYVIAPNAPLSLNSLLTDRFNKIFRDKELIRVISEFSLPTSLSQKYNPLYGATNQTELVKMVVWMLQHHLLMQLHTYVQYLPTENGPCQRNSKVPSLEKHLQPSGLSSSSNEQSAMLTSPRQSRTESESEVSVVSGTPEPHPDPSELLGNINLSNVSYSSADEDKQAFQDLLLDFPDEERMAIFKIHAASHPEDLNLFAKLCRNGNFDGNHHVEEIMYTENLRRGQLMQLLDKFRDVLVTYETEDPAIAMFYYSS